MISRLLRYWYLSYVKQQDITKQQQKLGATSPVSGFMWGIKQGAHAFSSPTGHMHHYRHQTDMQKIQNRNSQFPKSYIPSPGFSMFCRPVNYYDCCNINKYTIGKVFLMVCAKANSFWGDCQRLVVPGHLLFCSWSTTVYIFVRCVLWKNYWLLKYHCVHLANSCPPQVLE